MREAKRQAALLAAGAGITALIALSALPGAPRAQQQRGTTITAADLDVAAKCLPQCSKAELKDISDRIAKAKGVLEKSGTAIALRLEYLEKLKALVDVATKIDAAGGDIAAAIEVLKGPATPPRPTLSIVHAEYGDRQHGHVCEATSYLNAKCVLRKDDSTADGSNCVLDTVTPKDICGYDPSPQGVKEIFIEWACVTNGQRPTVVKQTPLRVPPTGPIRLICHLHKMGAASGGDEDAAPKEVEKRKSGG